MNVFAPCYIQDYPYNYVQQFPLSSYAMYAKVCATAFACRTILMVLVQREVVPGSLCTKTGFVVPSDASTYRWPQESSGILCVGWYVQVYIYINTTWLYIYILILGTAMLILVCVYMFRG